MKDKHFRITIYFITSLFCFLSNQLKAQNKIEFDRSIYDLGTFSEDSEPKICKFKFTNHLNKPIAISHIQSTCGCASPQYTKKAIQPGKSGEISVIYNPQGHPGHFNRVILVSFSGLSKKERLFIKGTVTSGAIRKDKSYPHVMDELQLRTTSIRLKPMRSDLQQQNIMVINSGNKPICLDIVSTIPCISATLVPNILQPNQKGEIEILRKADKSKDHPYCIRLKKNARRQKTAGVVSIIIEAEKCNQ